MRRLIWLAGLALAALTYPAQAQNNVAKVVTTCGTVSPFPTAGRPAPLTVDVNGNLCNSGGGGGGAVTVADGADVAEGTTTNGACAGDATSGCTSLQRLSRIAARLTTSIASLADILTAINSSIPAGTNIIGKVGIDQTTPGTTNLVALAANQSVNVAQINAVTPLMGNGVTGTGSPRVTLASDGTAISATGFMSVKFDQTTLGTTNGVTDAPANSSPTNISATTSGTPSTATTLLAASATHHKVVLKVEGASTVCFSQFGTAVIDSNGTWCLKGASSNNAGDGGSYVTPQGMTEPNAISMISTGTSVRVTGWWQ